MEQSKDDIKDEPNKNKEEVVVDLEETRRQLFQAPELPPQVIEKLWYNTKTQKIGCGIPKLSLQEHQHKLHREMFFSAEDSVQQDTNDSAIQSDVENLKQDRIQLKKVPNLWINDRISLAVLQKIQDRMKRYKPYFQTVDLHSPEALLYHRDFIQQMNMKYIEYSMQRLGINQSFDNWFFL